jgi:hypothetical protein
MPNAPARKQLPDHDDYAHELTNLLFHTTHASIVKTLPLEIIERIILELSLIARGERRLGRTCLRGGGGAPHPGRDLAAPVETSIVRFGRRVATCAASLSLVPSMDLFDFNPALDYILGDLDDEDREWAEYRMTGCGRRLMD